MKKICTNFLILSLMFFCGNANSQEAIKVSFPISVKANSSNFELDEVELLVELRDTAYTGTNNGIAFVKNTYSFKHDIIPTKYLVEFEIPLEDLAYFYFLDLDDLKEEMEKSKQNLEDEIKNMCCLWVYLRKKRNGERLLQGTNCSGVSSQRTTIQLYNIPYSDKFFIDRRDGQEYKIIDIGGVTWMAENMNYNQPGFEDYCFESGYEDYNCDKYGRLYDWESASKACPKGWHLPSQVEWQILLLYEGCIVEYGEKKKCITAVNNFLESGKNGLNVKKAGYAEPLRNYTSQNKNEPVPFPIIYGKKSITGFWLDFEAQGDNWEWYDNGYDMAYTVVFDTKYSYVIFRPRKKEDYYYCRCVKISEN